MQSPLTFVIFGQAAFIDFGLVLIAQVLLLLLVVLDSDYSPTYVPCHASTDTTPTTIVQATGGATTGRSCHRVAITTLASRIAIAATVVCVSAGFAQVQYRTLACGGAFKYRETNKDICR